MCGIPRELPLRREPLVKPFNHIVKRMAELFEFGQDVLADFHIGQIIRLNFFRLRSERTKRLQCLTADKIRKHTAEQSYCCRYIPIGCVKRFLSAVHYDCKVSVSVFAFGIKRIGLTALRIAASGYFTAYGVHISLAGIADKTIHQHAGDTY